MKRWFVTVLFLAVCSGALAQGGTPLYEGIYTMHCNGVIVPENKPFDMDDEPRTDTLRVYGNYMMFNDMRADYKTTLSNGTKVYATQTSEMDYAFQVTRDNDLYIFFSMRGAASSFRCGFYKGDRRALVRDQIADKKLLYSTTFTRDLLGAFFPYSGGRLASLTLDDLSIAEQNIEPVMEKFEVYGMHLMVGGRRYDLLMRGGNGWSMYNGKDDPEKALLLSDNREAVALIMDKSAGRVYIYPYRSGDQRVQIKSEQRSRRAVEEALRQQQAEAERRRLRAQRQQAIQSLTTTLAQMFSNIANVFMASAAPSYSNGNAGYSSSSPSRTTTSATTSNTSAARQAEYKFYKSVRAITEDGDECDAYVYVNRRNSRDFRVSYSKFDDIDSPAGKRIYNNTKAGNGMLQSYYFLNFGTAYYFDF